MPDPDPLPALEREVRSYAADSADPILRRALTGVLREYDRLLDVEHAAALLLDACDAREAAGMTTGAATVRQFLRDVRRTT